ncbi:MAG TPA: hypothetical protein VJX67_20560 [Blastocatellia bacterium]|nr:hypothetical protein [Blastocatellia bacterium]
MIILLLILAGAVPRTPLPQYPVRWTRAVGPPSRQALKAQLRQPVKKPRSQKIYEHTEAQREIRTCIDYASARRDGWSDSANTYERSTGSFFRDQCDVALLVLAAKPSRTSYLHNFKLNEAGLNLLPPSLSWAVSNDEEEAVAEAERKGLSWKSFNPALKVLEKGANSITVDEDGDRITLEIKAFGDFNGDGIEDVLLFKSCSATEGTMREYEPVVLTRVTAQGPLKAYQVEDKDIDKIAATFMHTAAVGAKNEARPEQ